MAVGIHEVEVEIVFAFVSAGEGHPQRNGALGMYRRELLRINRVKSAQQIQLAIVIRCRVAQNCYLNVHPATIKTHIPRIGTKKFHPLELLLSANSAN